VTHPTRVALSAAARPIEVSLLGVPLDPLTHGQVAERVLFDLDRGKGGYIVTPNLQILRSIRRSPILRTLALGAELRVVDGIPLLWASQIRGTPVPGRVAGSDLIWTLSQAAADHDRSVFLLGGSPGTAQLAGDVLKRRFAALRIAGTYCPPLGYDRDPEEIARICAELQGSNADVVYVGLPFPKASALVSVIRDRLDATWFLGLGVSFSFVCGDISRAPVWMQRTGLEWLHRLVQEPTRLFRRYILQGLPFVGTLFLSALLDRRKLQKLIKVTAQH
jgi:N-acetylglucosaminyldiphosphoundecaprenol N-acetyl-beta-D-mannosaminyltransferase